MKTISVVTIVVACVVLALSQANKTSPQFANTGRFSLISAQVQEGIGNSPETRLTVFVIDSQTGRTWRWFPDAAISGKKLVPAHFESVPFVRYGDTSDHEVEQP